MAVYRDFATALLQVRFQNPRRADARRSCLRVRQPLDNVRFSRYSVRFTEPRRADARRSCERAFVLRRGCIESFFAGRRSHRNQERLA
jgi:hypothetical protein